MLFGDGLHCGRGQSTLAFLAATDICGEYGVGDTPPPARRLAHDGAGRLLPDLARVAGGASTVRAMRGRGRGVIRVSSTCSTAKKYFSCYFFLLLLLECYCLTVTAHLLLQMLPLNCYRLKLLLLNCHCLTAYATA